MGVTLLPTHSCNEEMQKGVGARHWEHAENGAATTGGLTAIGGTGRAATGAMGATGATGAPLHTPLVQPKGQADERTHLASYTIPPVFWITYTFGPLIAANDTPELGKPLHVNVVEVFVATL